MKYHHPQRVIDLLVDETIALDSPSRRIDRALEWDICDSFNWEDSRQWHDAWDRASSCDYKLLDDRLKNKRIDAKHSYKDTEEDTKETTKSDSIVIKIPKAIVRIDSDINIKIR